MQAAMQAQREGRFLDAMIQLDNASKNAKASGGPEPELSLLRASFLLQGSQSRQALETLAPLMNKPQYAADAYALTAMAQLQQGQMQVALDAAQHAHDLDSGLLPHLALSYALQGAGRLTEARGIMHGFNGSASPSAIALAREAELALTLDDIAAARLLADHARAADATQPYVVAVSGQVYLIDGHTQQAKAAFETALQRDPKDAQALLGLGLAEIKLGNVQAGEEKLQAANEADPGNALILTYLGRAQMQLGQTGAAMASWHSAQQADPKDPIPWLYQAQAELQQNHPMAARESLREAQARLANRAVYRGERLLKEDEQLLNANLAEAQRRAGMDELAFHTLSDTVSEKNSANLRNQADLLQGQRFGESARRSLLLQSLFDDRPGNLPSELDIYGDGAGLTGAQAPQHGIVSELGAQQASYNTYDSLFAQRSAVAVDAIKGNQGTSGGQVRMGVGSDTLGVSLALRDYKTDGTGGPVANRLNNRIGQGVVQWRPDNDTQAFVSYQEFHSLHGEIQSPADPINVGNYQLIQDNSSVMRVGVRQSLSDHSELRALISRQQTDQVNNYEFISFLPPLSTSGLPGMGPTLPFPQATFFASSNAHSAELQYRTDDADSATQWGAHLYRAPYVYSNFNFTSSTRQVYVARQQMLSPQWQVDAHLGWEAMNVADNNNGGYSLIYIQRWLPQLGIVYTPDRATHVRLAAWHEIAGDTVGDATLAPATVAGIAMKRPGERNNLVQSVALAADRQLNAAWLLDARAQQRYADQDAQGTFIRQQIDDSRLALHWRPDDQPLMMSVAYDYERVKALPGLLLGFAPAWNSVDGQRLRSHQLDLHWFATEQWTMNLNWSRNLVAGTLQSSNINFSPILVPFQESFNQTDASLAWQFRKTGSMSLGVRNAGNTHFQYTNLDPFNPRFSTARFAYARLNLAW